MYRTKHALILIVDLIGLVIITSIILFTLNYFKILPLSTTFPEYLGFLPQRTQQEAVKSPTTPADDSTDIVWSKKANSNLISNYSEYFKAHNIPIAVSDQDPGLFYTSGVFTAYNKNYIEVVTPQGTIAFQIDNNPIYQKISPPTTSKNQGNSGDSRITVAYKNSGDFFRDVPFGGFLQISYRNIGNIKSAVSIDYYPEYKY